MRWRMLALRGRRDKPACWGLWIRSRSPPPGWCGGRPQYGRAQPMAGLECEVHVVAVTADRSAETFLRLADPVLDRVLMQHQLFGGRLVAAPSLQEDQ